MNVVLDTQGGGSHKRPSGKCCGTRLSTSGDGDTIVAYRAAPLELGLVWVTHCLERFELAANFYNLGVSHCIQIPSVSWKKSW